MAKYMPRAGENRSADSRQDRFFKKGSYWYYSTREGVDIGPFDNQRDAENGVNDFIDFISCAPADMVETLEAYGTAA